MDTIIIRDACPADVENIALLEESTFPFPWTRESLMHDVTANELAIVLVAECDGHFAGYADVWCIAGEGQLNNIAVCSEYRGRHIGQAIMEEIYTRLREKKCGEISLEVRPSNTPAIRLYEKLGMTVCGRREGYYLDNGEAALIMRASIELQ